MSTEAGSGPEPVRVYSSSRPATDGLAPFGRTEPVDERKILGFDFADELRWRRFGDCRLGRRFQKERAGRADGELAPLWVRYKDMIPNKEDRLKSVAKFCGLGASDADLAAAIAATDGDKEKTRFNKGVAGRGAEAFSVEQHEMLRSLTKPFPSIDFSPIGL